MRGFLGKEGVTSSNLVISSIQKCSVYGFLRYEEARFFVPRNVVIVGFGILSKYVLSMSQANFFGKPSAMKRSIDCRGEKRSNEIQRFL